MFFTLGMVISSITVKCTGWIVGTCSGGFMNCGMKSSSSWQQHASGNNMPVLTTCHCLNSTKVTQASMNFPLWGHIRWKMRLCLVQRTAAKFFSRLRIAKKPTTFHAYHANLVEQLRVATSTVAALTLHVSPKRSSRRHYIRGELISCSKTQSSIFLFILCGPQNILEILKWQLVAKRFLTPGLKRSNVEK